MYIYIYIKLYIHIYTLWIPLIQTWLERSRFIRWFFRQNQPDLLGDSPASHLADSRRVQGTNSCSLATLQFVDVCCLPAKPFLKWAIDMVLSQNKSGEKSQNPVVYHGFRKSRPLVICDQFWPFDIPNFQTYRIVDPKTFPDSKKVVLYHEFGVIVRRLRPAGFVYPLVMSK